jgi:hypothetical protein
MGRARGILGGTRRPFAPRSGSEGSVGCEGRRVLGEGGLILRIVEYEARLIPEQGSVADLCGGNDGKAGGECFEEDERARVSAGGQEEEVGRPHEVRDVPTEAEKMDTGGDAEVLCEGGVGAVRELASYGHMEVGNLDEGAEHRVQVFDRGLDVPDEEAKHRALREA